MSGVDDDSAARAKAYVSARVMRGCPFAFLLGGCVRTCHLRNLCVSVFVASAAVSADQLNYVSLSAAESRELCNPIVWDPARGRLSLLVYACFIFGAVEVALLRHGVRDGVPGSLLLPEAGVGQVQVCMYACACADSCVRMEGLCYDGRVLSGWRECFETSPFSRNAGVGQVQVQH